MSGNENKQEMIPHPKTESRRDHPGCDGKEKRRGAYILQIRECSEKRSRIRRIERSLKTGILPEIYETALKKEIRKD